MMNKKIYSAAIGTALVLTSVFAITAFAEQENQGNHDTSSMKRSTIKPLENLLKRIEKFEAKDFSFNTQQLETNVPSTMTINGHGETRITNGKITAVSGDIVTVEVWKLAFSVHKMPETKVFAGNKKELTFEQITVGDMVSVLGQLDDTKPAFIHAQAVHDRTQAGKANEGERGRLQALIDELVKRLHALSDNPTSSVSPSPWLSPSPSSSALPSPSPSASSSPLPSSSPSPSSSRSPS